MTKLNEFEKAADLTDVGQKPMAGLQCNLVMKVPQRK
jgi:hypothetical protein